MDYKDYQDARDVAWKLLVDFGADRLPVSVSQICKELGVPIKYYNGAADNDGESMMWEGHPIILINKSKPAVRQRFTAAHELGHILLGHVGKYELVNREPSSSDNPIETAANVFASRLLAPACVLWGCGVKSAQDISELCQISTAAAEFRWARMQILFERNKFLISPLERQVYRQFTVYIEENKL